VQGGQPEDELSNKLLVSNPTFQGEKRSGYNMPIRFLIYEIDEIFLCIPVYALWTIADPLEKAGFKLEPTGTKFVYKVIS
jgi:hypothetical protein